jgi:hypothetical protein
VYGAVREPRKIWAFSKRPYFSNATSPGFTTTCKSLTRLGNLITFLAKDKGLPMMNRVILTAHQPAYLPWLGLFHKISLADKFVFLDDVQYQTGDWNNRNKIKTSQGPTWLTVPVLSKHHLHLNVKEVHINNTPPWRRKHLKSIHLAYGKAPYFSRYIDFFEEVYFREWEKLADLNEYMLKQFLKLLGLEVPFSKLSDFPIREKKSALVLELCRQMNADLFVFGALGRDYADVPAFERAGIQVYFQQYEHPVYQQLHGPFVSGLSIVDLLFNHGETSIEILQGNNTRKFDLIKQFMR